MTATLTSFNYTAAQGSECKITITPQGDKFVCVASNDKASMVLSEPRDYNGAVRWAKKFIGIDENQVDHDAYDMWLSERVGFWGF